MRKSSVLTVGTFVISKSGAKIQHFFELCKSVVYFFEDFFDLQSKLCKIPSPLSSGFTGAPVNGATIFDVLNKTEKQVHC